MPNKIHHWHPHLAGEERMDSCNGALWKRKLVNILITAALICKSPDIKNTFVAVTLILDEEIIDHISRNSGRPGCHQGSCQSWWPCKQASTLGWLIATTDVWCAEDVLSFDRACDRLEEVSTSLKVTLMAGNSSQQNEGPIPNTYYLGWHCHISPWSDFALQIQSSVYIQFISLRSGHLPPTVTPPWCLDHPYWIQHQRQYGTFWHYLCLKYVLNSTRKYSDTI